MEIQKSVVRLSLGAAVLVMAGIAPRVPSHRCIGVAMVDPPTCRTAPAMAPRPESSAH